MIGNDVVDLALARKESNWKRPGFLDKIFTKNEQQIIAEHVNPEVLIWNLWSRKEAVYKIFNRETGIRAFFPNQIECFYTSETLGYVVCKGTCYFTKTIIDNDFLYSVAVSDLTYFNQIISLNTSDTIVKRNGIPFVYCEKTNYLKAASISHHGRFEQSITIK